jgi:tRNA modification GTPase
MHATCDTIVGVATPAGRGGLGVVRLSGPAAHDIVRRLIARPALEPRCASFARLLTNGDVEGRALDEVVVTFFPAPRSYTREDVVEISAHGSPVVLEAIVGAALHLGARLARPGEFTLRAFVNGRIDLIQAEAVADLIDAVTPRQAAAAYDQLAGSLSTVLHPISSRLFGLVTRLEASLDFPEEGYHFITQQELAGELAALRADVEALVATAAQGALLRQGASVALLGPPNAGKSTLFNALVGSRRAIVSPQPGTTRDVLAETVDLEGVPVTLIDAAGLRDCGDPVEREGVERAWAAAEQAAVILLLLDGSRVIGSDDIDMVAGATRLRGERVLVRTKSDLPRAWDGFELGRTTDVSALTGDGLRELRQSIADRLQASSARDELPRVTNVRHRNLLSRAGAALARAEDCARNFMGHVPEEVVLVELTEARTALEEVTGQRTSEDVLASIFERFCIGK